MRIDQLGQVEMNRLYKDIIKSTEQKIFGKNTHQERVFIAENI